MLYRVFIFFHFFLFSLVGIGQDTLILEPLNSFTVFDINSERAQVFNAYGTTLYAKEYDSESVMQFYNMYNDLPGYDGDWLGDVGLGLPSNEGSFVKVVSKQHHLVAFYDGASNEEPDFARYWVRKEVSPGVPDEEDLDFEMDRGGDIDIVRDYFVDFIHTLDGSAYVLEKRFSDIWIKQFGYEDNNNLDANVMIKLEESGQYEGEALTFIQRISSNTNPVANITVQRNNGDTIAIAGGNTVVVLSFTNPEKPAFIAGKTFDDYADLQLVGYGNFFYARGYQNGGSPTGVLSLREEDLEIMSVIPDRGGDVSINQVGTGLTGTRDVVNFLSPFGGRLYKYKEFYDASRPPFFINYNLDASSDNLFPDPTQLDEPAWIHGQAIGSGKLISGNRFISDYYLIWYDPQIEDFNESLGYVLFNVKQQERGGVGISESDDKSIEYPYPNPTSDILTIPFKKNGGDAELTIYNAAGNVVFKTKVAQSKANGVAIDTKQFSPGRYIYRFNVAGDSYQNGSFTKQ